jgi:hypothetical protein
MADPDPDTDPTTEVLALLNRWSAESGRGSGQWPQPCGVCGGPILRPEDALLESLPAGDDLRDPRIVHTDEASPHGRCAREGRKAQPLIWFIGTAGAEWYWQHVAEGAGADQPAWAALGAQLGQWTPSPLLAPEAGEPVH